VRTRVGACRGGGGGPWRRARRTSASCPIPIPRPLGSGLRVGAPRPRPCAPQGARSKGSGPGSNRIGRGSGTHARRQPAALVFREETGGSFRGRPGTPGAPTGRTPIARRVGPRREVSTVVALTVSGRIATRHLDPAVPGPDVVASLRPLRRGRPGPPRGIGARSPAPRSAAGKVARGQHPEILVEGLPTDALRGAGRRRLPGGPGPRGTAREPLPEPEGNGPVPPGPGVPGVGVNPGAAS
jgi:hypothetical protein